MKNNSKLVIAFACFFTLLTSCDKDSDNIINTPEEETINPAKIIYSMNFEKDSEDFSSGIFCNHPHTKVLNTNEDDNHCGIVFRGTKENFKDWKEYSYKGNDTFFLGTDYENCGGFFTSSVEKEIELTSNFLANDINIQFMYYKPGDFTGWAINYYDFKVDIFEKDYSYDTLPLFSFTPENNPSGWVTVNTKVTSNLQKGTYKLVITQTGGQSAIDDIVIYKN